VNIGGATAVRLSGLGKRFRQGKHRVQALEDISMTVSHGALVALVGPDGAGKTTLLRLIAGLMAPDAGTLEVLGIDVVREPQAVQDRIGYMPQKFGLYDDLSVEENLNLYADLHGLPTAERKSRYAQLAEMTELAPFQKRLVAKLSGGMKQKLGIACTLLSSPDLLLLDEPTVGVDPVSRRDLWRIVDELVKTQQMTVIVSTPYLGEAELADQVLMLDAGLALAEGPPAEVTALAKGRTFRAVPQGEAPRELQARLLAAPDVIDAVPEAGMVRVVTAAGGHHGDIAMTAVPPRFEDGFMMLARQAGNAPSFATPSLSLGIVPDGGDIIEVRDVIKKFGSFIAVDRISFSVRPGEIFGLLGPNGAGKTTTFRMLCGLLPASGGTLRVASVDLRTARASARQRVGYVAQKFSLYGLLSVTQNLEFFAGAYGLAGRRRRQRIDWAMEQFDLSSLAGLPSGQLPGGYKQRLSMAAALIHEPEILFLDEPTSGADPLARREFWQRITALADQGVTIIVTTHFMEEAEYCDRVVILDAGQVLAQGTPAEIRSRAPSEAGHEPTMEDAFIAIVEEGRCDHGPSGLKDAA
jgi:pyoluteorin transport system ATP-binding protein